MSDSAAGIVTTQALSADPAQPRQRGIGESGNALSNKGFSSVLPEHMDQIQNDTASIMLPTGLVQSLESNGKLLPPVAIGNSQFLPDGKPALKSGRMIASLSLNDAARFNTETKKGGISLTAAHRQIDSQALASRAELVEQRLEPGTQQKSLSLDMEQSITAKFSSSLERVDGGIKPGGEQTNLPVNDRQNGQYALSQSVVVSRETGESGSSKAEIHVGPRFNHQDWGNAIAARVNWQVGERVQVAQFSINPPELGPVEVKISIDNDKASVQFNVQNGAVKEALEDALPRLKELMSQSGMSLADSNVSQQSKDQNSEHLAQNDPTSTEKGRSEDETESGDLLTTTIKVRQGLVDDYV